MPLFIFLKVFLSLMLALAITPATKNSAKEQKMSTNSFANLILAMDYDGKEAKPYAQMGDQKYLEIEKLIDAHPALLKDLDQLAKVAHHFSQQRNYFRMLNDPEGFKKSYMERYNKEEKGQPYNPYQPKLSDFGIPDFQVIKKPIFADQTLTFFVIDQHTGLPYQGVYKRGKEVEYTPVAMTQVESSSQKKVEKKADDHRIHIYEICEKDQAGCLSLKRPGYDGGPDYVENENPNYQSSRQYYANVNVKVSPLLSLGKEDVISIKEEGTDAILSISSSKESELKKRLEKIKDDKFAIVHENRVINIDFKKYLVEGKVRIKTPQDEVKVLHQIKWLDELNDEGLFAPVSDKDGQK